MRLNYEVRDRGQNAAEAVAAIVAPILGWDDERYAKEITDFAAHVGAQTAAEETTDDAAAAALIEKSLS